MADTSSILAAATTKPALASTNDDNASQKQPPSSVSAAAAAESKGSRSGSAASSLRNSSRRSNTAANTHKPGSKPKSPAAAAATSSAHVDPSSSSAVSVDKQKQRQKLVEVIAVDKAGAATASINKRDKNRSPTTTTLGDKVDGGSSRGTLGQGSSSSAQAPAKAQSKTVSSAASSSKAGTEVDGTQQTALVSKKKKKENKAQTGRSTVEKVIRPANKGDPSTTTTTDTDNGNVDPAASSRKMSASNTNNNSGNSNNGRRKASNNPSSSQPKKTSSSSSRSAAGGGGGGGGSSSLGNLKKVIGDLKNLGTGGGSGGGGSGSGQSSRRGSEKSSSTTTPAAAAATAAPVAIPGSAGSLKPDAPTFVPSSTSPTITKAQPGGGARGSSFGAAHGTGLELPALGSPDASLSSLDYHQQNTLQQRLQAQAQAQLAQVRSIPPRFQRSAGAGPGVVYEEEAVSLDDYHGIAAREDVGGASSAAQMLAGLAARAHRRTGSEAGAAASQQQQQSSQLLQQQINLQAQIDALQAQQRLLLQQQQAVQLPAGLAGLLANSSDPAALQQKYLEVLAQQQIQQQAQLQATMRNITLGGPGGDSRRPADDFASAPPPRMTDMGPPPAPSSTSQHRQRDSIHSHRPRSSIMGSYGGFVNDYEDQGGPTLPAAQHHRSGSQSWRNGNNNGDSSNNSVAPAVMDLTAAQAQLKALSQFRATEIAGGISGHSKMASFSFPNMLPNLMMASQMGTTTQSALQQQQAFQMQLAQSSGPGPQRKSLFAPYLPQGSLPALLAAGKLVAGTLRVNKRNRSDAYVATDVLDADIYICGSKDRNRALEGDIVAVELLDVDEVWSSKKDKEEKKRKKEESTQVQQKKSNDKRNDDVEVEGQGLVLFEDEEVTDEQKPLYAGHVVAVVERVNNQLFTGQLNVLRPSAAATQAAQQADGRPPRKDERPKIVWFKPTDKRVPLIAIPTDQAPSDFLERPEKYANQLFVANIKRWPITSLHPFGSLVDKLGSIGDIEVETAALLKDCNITSEEFPEAALKCLPPTPWIIPEHEYSSRRDMREHRVFTIDPETAKDLDDALSITECDGGYEVGVHIADVSYFVKANNALDRDARKKATSVYLIQRAVPMLPPLLSEQLCSLVPGVERLAFSCYFKLDKAGNVLEHSFQKSIIKSCVKLAYADAQRVIDGGSIDKEVDGHLKEEVANDINLLQSLATQIRQRRFEDGALKINNVKLSFKLDDSGQPIDCSPYSGTAANSLIEEFMLMANIAAAQTIAFGLPEQAILRRHEPPIQRRIEAFVDRAKGLGFGFEGTSSREIQSSFDAVGQSHDKLVLSILSTRAMNR